MLHSTTAFEASLAGAWAIALLAFCMALRLGAFVLRQISAYETLYVGSGDLDLDGRAPPSELAIGLPAPPFLGWDLAGRTVDLTDIGADLDTALVFVSPNCGHCRRVLVELLQLLPLIHANTRVVIVSDGNPTRTGRWLQALGLPSVDPVPVVLSAPLADFRSVNTYNPRGRFPYFCLVTRDGLVAARGPAVPGSQEWFALLARLGVDGPPDARQTSGTTGVEHAGTKGLAPNRPQAVGLCEEAGDP